jgi:hypothetical protein
MGIAKAFPAVQSVTVSNNGGSTTHNAAMPATVDAGDLLLNVACAEAANSSPTFNTPVDWTAVQDLADADDVRVTLFAKSAAGDEDGASVNFSTNVNADVVSHVFRITGWSGSIATGIEMSALVAGFQNPDPPALNPANWDVEDTLWIAAAERDTSTPSFTSYPASYTGAANTLQGDLLLMTAHRQNAVASENPGAFGTDNGQSNAWTIAVRPASAGSPAAVRSIYYALRGVR